MDGARSTLLAVVGLGCHPFGDIHTVRIEHPEFKCLHDGTINELKVRIQDDTGCNLDDHCLPSSVGLELIVAMQHDHLWP